jgi:thymidylate synthase
MTQFIVDVDRSWYRDLDYVFNFGAVTKPRGMLIRESIAYKSIIDMKSPIIMNRRRKLGYKFMAAEAAWILSGDDRLESIKPYSKDIEKFSDDGVAFFGAYGPKIINQISSVRDTLISDRDSRQAVLTIWRQNPPPSKDIPCTIALQWLIRNNVIHCVASMRSSDLWLGHPYDIFNFSAVSFYLMLLINQRTEDKILDLGLLHLTAGSKHIYDRNMEDVSDILSSDVPEVGSPDVFNESLYSRPDEFISHLWDCANSDEGSLKLL